MKSLKIRIIILELVESSKDSLGELYLKIYNRLKMIVNKFLHQNVIPIQSLPI